MADGNDFLEFLRKGVEAGSAKDKKGVGETDIKSAEVENAQLEIGKEQQAYEEWRDSQRRVKQIHLLRIATIFVLFIVAGLWMLAILAIVGASAWIRTCGTPLLRLSDPVLIALLSSSTLNILGFCGIAARWLFGPQKQDR